MTLKEWSDKQPLAVQRHPKYFNSFWVPDSLSLVDRAEAWRLDDYLVSAVEGGSIWFAPRHPITEEKA
jgi:hypothetical protein